jgi:hypothetical protein
LSAAWKRPIKLLALPRGWRMDQPGVMSHARP